MIFESISARERCVTRINRDNLPLPQNDATLHRVTSSTERTSFVVGNTTHSGVHIIYIYTALQNIPYVIVGKNISQNMIWLEVNRLGKDLSQE